MPGAAAIVHDFFIQDGGAERCALEFAAMFPDASVHTTFFDRKRFGDRLDVRRVRTWPLQRLLGATPRFRHLLPLYPLYFSALAVDADLVLSSSVAFAKATRTRPGATHVTYAYTPMRYAWRLDSYLEHSSLGLGARIAARMVQPMLQRWDVATARRPDVVVAISNTIRQRIRDCWGREADAVIYPPVDVEEIPFCEEDDGYLLIASRLLAYRRIDLAVEACSRLGVRLVVVGEGPERARLERLAGPSVTFLGHVPRARLLKLLARARGYVLPGTEDFGIAPVEAMAAGKPVLAYRDGGATETVVEGTTGLFFDEPTVESALKGLEELAKLDVDRAAVRRRAREFDVTVFRANWASLLANL